MFTNLWIVLLLTILCLKTATKFNSGIHEHQFQEAIKSRGAVDQDTKVRNVTILSMTLLILQMGLILLQNEWRLENQQIFIPCHSIKVTQKSSKVHQAYITYRAEPLRSVTQQILLWLLSSLAWIMFVYLFSLVC